MNKLKIWTTIHKWTSLISTLFLLILCITGLPLIFHVEINKWTHDNYHIQSKHDLKNNINIDQLIDIAKNKHPHKEVQIININHDKSFITIAMAKPYFIDNREMRKEVRINMNTGKILTNNHQQEQIEDNDKHGVKQYIEEFMHFMFELHKDLFLGFIGMLFLAIMGVMMFIAIISGIVLYQPFMQKLVFGTVRTDRSKRVKWLDLHNLVGIVIALWLGVVVITGVFIELSIPANIGVQKAIDKVRRPYLNEQSISPNKYVPLQPIIDQLKYDYPDKTIQTIIFPKASEISTPVHYVLAINGNTTLQKRFYHVVIADVRTGKIGEKIRLPWYVNVLQISAPLHFGDYGGLPMKILWFILDLLTIVVLITGLYLWWGKRKVNKKLKNQDSPYE